MSVLSVLCGCSNLWAAPGGDHAVRSPLWLPAFGPCACGEVCLLHPWTWAKRRGSLQGPWPDQPCPWAAGCIWPWWEASVWQVMHREEGIFIAAWLDTSLCQNDSCPLSCSSTDVHTVASLLKLYIRELPEPIVPFSKYTQFLSCAQILTKDTEMVILYLSNKLLVRCLQSWPHQQTCPYLFKGTMELSKQVKSLPQVNYNLLKYICKWVSTILRHIILLVCFYRRFGVISA